MGYISWVRWKTVVTTCINEIWRLLRQFAIQTLIQKVGLTYRYKYGLFVTPVLYSTCIVITVNISLHA